MPIDQGLMAGSAVAEGLGAFATAYNSAKNQAQELAIKERLANAQGLDAFSKLMDTTAGNVISDPNTLGTLKSYGILGPGAGGPDKGYLPPPKPTTLDNTQPATPANPGQAPSGSQYLNHTTPTIPQQQPQQGPQDPFQMEPDAFTKWSMDNLGGQQRKAVQAEYWKRKDPQYQATLSNTLNQRPDANAKEFQGNDVVKKANDVNLSYNSANQVFQDKQQTAGGQKAFLHSVMQVFRNGQPSRGTSGDDMEDVDPAWASKIKAGIEKNTNNVLLTRQEMNAIMKGASQHVIGMKDEVNHQAGVFGASPQNINSQTGKSVYDFKSMSNDPTYSLAKKNAQRIGDEPVETPKTMATGFLTAAKGFLTGKKPDTATANQAFTPDVVNYAKQHKLTNEQALAIKNKRIGK